MRLLTNAQLDRLRRALEKKAAKRRAAVAAKKAAGEAARETARDCTSAVRAAAPTTPRSSRGPR